MKAAGATRGTEVGATNTDGESVGLKVAEGVDSAVGWKVDEGVRSAVGW